MIEFIALCTILCLFGIVVCVAGVVLEKMRFSKRQQFICIAVSVPITIYGIVITLNKIENFGFDYGFEAPLIFFTFIFAAPWLIGKLFNFVFVHN